MMIHTICSKGDKEFNDYLRSKRNRRYAILAARVFLIVLTAVGLWELTSFVAGVLK